MEDGGRQIHLKYLYLCTALHGVISQKTLMLRETDIILYGSRTDYQLFNVSVQARQSFLMFYKTICSSSETAQQKKSSNFSVHIIVVCCCSGDIMCCSMLGAVCCAQGLCSFEQFLVNMFISEY